MEFPFRLHPPFISMNKYRNKKTEVDGITFDSRKEAMRYMELKLLQRGHVIKDLELQPKFDLIVNEQKVGFYKADFRYVEGGEVVIEDCKSAMTAKLPVYRLKKKLMKAIHGIDIRET